jgi:hypothetical protein
MIKLLKRRWFWSAIGLVCVAAFCVLILFPFQRNRHIDADQFPLLKVGMTAEEVEAVLGNPDYAESQKLVYLEEVDRNGERIVLTYTFRFDASGRLWLLEHGTEDKSSIWQTLRYRALRYLRK